MSQNRIDTSVNIESGSESFSIYSSDNTASFSVFSVINNDEVFNIYSDGSVHAGEFSVLGGITIGSKTNGDYVQEINTGTGVSLTGSIDSTISIGQPIGTSDSPTFLNVETIQGVSVSGEVNVSGSLTIINSGNVSFSDNIIVLNSNSTSPPTEDAGIEVERGSLDNVLIKWDESLEKWRITNDGLSYFDIPEEINLNDLSDVSITSPSENQIIYYDGSTWINETVSSPQAISGSVLAYVSPTPPSGWLICDGSEISQSTYSSLYAVIGSTYNDGSESVGNFRLPDYRNVLCYGSDTISGENLLVTGSRSPAHSHNSSLLEDNAPHAHSSPFNISGTITSHTHSITSETGGDPAHTHPNPGGNAISATGNMPHGHPAGNHGESANHNHNAPNGPASAAGTGGTHTARHGPPAQTTRNSGTTTGHTHPAGGANVANANANHSHSGVTGPVTITANHGHNAPINTSNTGAHSVNFGTTTHSHSFSVSPDETNTHTHTATSSSETETHTHEIIGVPVYFIIKT
jgi:microcystin-dependent protein